MLITCFPTQTRCVRQTLVVLVVCAHAHDQMWRCIFVMILRAKIIPSMTIQWRYEDPMCVTRPNPSSLHHLGRLRRASRTCTRPTSRTSTSSPRTCTPPRRASTSSETSAWRPSPRQVCVGVGVGLRAVGFFRVWVWGLGGWVWGLGLRGSGFGVRTCTDRRVQARRLGARLGCLLRYSPGGLGSEGWFGPRASPCTAHCRITTLDPPQP